MSTLRLLLMLFGYTLLLTIYDSYYSNVDPNSQVLETQKTNPELSRKKTLRKVNLVKKKVLNSLLKFNFYIAQNAGNTDQ